MDARRLILGLLLVAPAAHAQYNLSTLSIGPQASSVVGDRPQWGVALGYTRYLESGFEVFARAPVLISHTLVGADTLSGEGNVLGTGLTLGARYLFLEDAWRPWVGLQLGASFLITKPEVTWFAGPGASAGLDWVFNTSFAVGVLGSYDVFIRLNAPWRHQLSVLLNFSILL